MERVNHSQNMTGAKMELPVVEKFCFIINLRAGCITMGIINCMVTLFLAVLLITHVVEMKELEQLRRDDSDAAMSSVVFTIIILLAVLLIIKFLVDIVFIYAAYKEKCGMMKKYCIFWIVFLVLFIIAFLKTLFQLSAGYVIAQILFLAENLYCLIVFRSYLLSINEDGVL
ncbi:uncharacterized protein LOC106715571 [Papilio machaon]|uniref:uncharacterized protein LOC106715571 n=1 Tax=Papilio machaon TaxID=76193 RepID=UPI001E664588|nr:uncharacterized protein LOC106715571 [Papilio machaon]